MFELVRRIVQGFRDDQIRAERYLNLRYDGTDVAVMTLCPDKGNYADVNILPSTMLITLQALLLCFVSPGAPTPSALKSRCSRHLLDYGILSNSSWARQTSRQPMPANEFRMVLVVEHLCGSWASQTSMPAFLISSADALAGVRGGISPRIWVCPGGPQDYC